MAYGQKNYNEYVGNSKYRIAQIGCFLVSFSNLLQRFGNDTDPLRLNREFTNRGAYLADASDGGVRDLLSWWSVASYDNSIVVTATGKGVPPHNDCIVGFNYGAGLTHFSLVADKNAGTIVDSFDGKVKSWNIYGGPKTWAAYKDNTPNIQPVSIAPVPTSANYVGGEVTVLPGWGIANAAKAAGWPDWDTETRWNAIAQLNGHANRNDFRLFAGMRIKVGSPQAAAPAPVQQAADTVVVQKGWGLSKVAQAAGFADYDTAARWAIIASLNGSSNWGDFNKRLAVGQVVRVREAAPVAVPTPAPVAAPTPVVEAAPAVVTTPTEEKIAVTVVPVNYKDTYIEDAKEYIATENIVVKDLDGLQKDLQLVANQKVNASGTFVKDGITYVRSKYHAKNGLWYGVPMTALANNDTKKYVGKLRNDDDLDDDELFNIDLSLETKELLHTLSSREKVVATVGKIQYFFTNVFGKLRFNKKKEDK